MLDTRARVCIVGPAALAHALAQELAHGRFASSFGPVVVVVDQGGNNGPSGDNSNEGSERDQGQNTDLTTALHSPHFFAPFDAVCIAPLPCASLGLSRLEAAGLLFDACEQAGCNNVVLLSHDHPDWVARVTLPHLFEYRRIEHRLKESAIGGHCIVRLPFLHEYLRLWVNHVSETGVLAMPLFNGTIAPVRLSDVVSTVAGIFSFEVPCGPHMCPMLRSSVHKISGPTALSGDDIARLFEEALGHPVTYTSNSRNETKRFLERRIAAGAMLGAGYPLAENDMHIILEMFDAASREADCKDHGICDVTKSLPTYPLDKYITEITADLPKGTAGGGARPGYGFSRRGSVSGDYVMRRPSLYREESMRREWREKDDPSAGKCGPTTNVAEGVSKNVASERESAACDAAKSILSTITGSPAVDFIVTSTTPANAPGNANASSNNQVASTTTAIAGVTITVPPQSQ